MYNKGSVKPVQSYSLHVAFAVFSYNMELKTSKRAINVCIFRFKGSQNNIRAVSNIHVH